MDDVVENAGGRCVGLCAVVDTPTLKSVDVDVIRVVVALTMVLVAKVGSLSTGCSEVPDASDSAKS